MKIDIKLAKKENIKEIEKFYEVVVDDLMKNINYPGWEKGIYPTVDDIINGIKNNDLYTAYYNEKIIGSVIINNVQESNYRLVDWSIEAKNNEIYVIHTLAIHPEYKGLKIAMQLLDYAETLAKNNNIKTIRLDVRKENIPAIKLYEKCNYNYVGEINLHFGLFKLYEKII